MSLLLLTSALFFAVLATVDWQRLPLNARIHLGVATAFAIAAATGSSMAFGPSGDGIATLLAAALAAGLAAVAVSVATALRRLVVRP